MIREFWCVLCKEIIDNLRDRRTLLTVLVFGPLFGPVLYTVMMNVIINQQVGDVGKPLKLPVAGAQYAPNLVEYLRQHNTRIEPAPGDPQSAVTNGEQDVVLVIPKAFQAEFRSGSPAVLRLVQDASRQSAAKNVRRAQGLLESYAREISSLRLLVHGVDPNDVMVPLAVENVDVSTPQSRAAIILSFVPY
ncbi:MAG: ABC transporter permease, partial [Gammaproteobacteria bacterium]